MNEELQADMFPDMPRVMVKLSARDKLVKKIRVLRKRGHTVRDISKFISVPYRTVEGWSNLSPRHLPVEWAAKKILEELKNFS